MHNQANDPKGHGPSQSAYIMRFVKSVCSEKQGEETAEVAHVGWSAGGEEGALPWACSAVLLPASGSLLLRLPSSQVMWPQDPGGVGQGGPQ